MTDTDDAPNGRCSRCREALLPEEVGGAPGAKGLCVTCVPRDLHMPPPVEVDPMDMTDSLYLDLG
jgi:hypothetical protein